MADRRKQRDQRRYVISGDSAEGYCRKPYDRRKYGSDRRKAWDAQACVARWKVEEAETGTHTKRSGQDRRQP
jgi:hypothetical protein